MKSGIFFCFVLTALYFGSSWGLNMDYQEVHRQIFDLILNSDKLDPRIRPTGENSTGPVKVTTNILVRSFSKIDDIKQEYKIMITYRNTWVDKRLEFPGDVKYINLNHEERIWTPDVFFSNERNGHTHDLLHPNVLIRVYPDGKVLYSTRLSLTLSCPMNFRRFPHDSQTCSIIMPSYAWTTEDLVLLWKETDPIQITKNLHIPNFALTNVNTEYCSARTVTGEYSCLKAQLNFKRSCQKFLLRVYIPSIMIILVSYLHFWMNVKATTGRVLLALGSLMVMSAGTVDLSHSLPETDYTKAIDVWTGVCLTFLFWSLVEFVIVHYLANKKSGDGTLVSNGEATAFEKKLSNRLLGFFSNLSVPERIDVISRVAYPTLFLLFNLIYWATYLPSSEPAEVV